MMMLGLRPIDTGDKVFSITPSAMSLGSVTSASGFTLGADPVSVMTATAYGATTKVFGRTGTYPVQSPAHTEALFETTARGRDVVVTTWFKTGAMYLRCDRTTGRGIQVSLSNGGDIRVIYVKNIPATLAGFTNLNPIGLDILPRTAMSSLVTGWNPNSTSGDEFTFSLIGTTLTIEWNGQTVFETDTIFYHMVPGRVVYSTGSPEGAIRDTEITFKASAPTYTDGENLILDFRDWGLKEFVTLGSMSAGSTTLTVGSTAGLAIGDRIIVEIGGEAGAGLRGTVGVGGTWPRDRYANSAALPNAATYRAANGNVDCYAWIEDTGKVWINFLNAGVPTWTAWTDFAVSTPVIARSLWYSTQLWPLSLKATITNISGNTITLDTASQAATTNANVYYDSSWMWEYLLPNSRFSNATTNVLSTDPWEYRFPAGTFCFTGIYTSPLISYSSLKGAGRSSTQFLAPKGTVPPRFIIGGEYITISDFKVKGWVGPNYIGFDNGANYATPGQHSVMFGGTYLNGGLIERIDFENTWGGINLSTRFGALARDCTGVQTNGNNQIYGAWFFVSAYCDQNTWFEDITYTATEMANAFEIFQADGGGFKRCTATQGVFASNSSGGGFLMEDCVINIDWNYRTTGLDWTAAELPAININTNIGSGAFAPQIIEFGGTIRNPTINIIKDATGKMANAINVNGGAVNIRVEGTHTAKPGQGVITMSDYAPGDASRGAVAILMDPPGCSVDGIRVIGTAGNIGGGEFSNISIRNYTMPYSTTVPDSTAPTNCVAETIAFQTPKNGTHVQQLGVNGNMTNAEYEALP